MKWFFHFCMWLSALFLPWIYGGNRWNSSSSSDIKKLSVLEHSLSRMRVFAFRPLYLSFFSISLYAIVISVPYFDFSFEYCSYATIMYLYHLADVTWNRPVWSIYILDKNSIIEKNTWCDRVRGISSSDITFFGIYIHC